MKCTVVFLVLSMVVLMAEPGEGFLGALFGLGRMIHGIIRSRRRHGLEELQALEDLEKMEKQQEKQFEKRSLDFKPARAAFR